MATQLGSRNGAKTCQKMNILAISDVVEPQLYSDRVKRYLGQIDLLVSCGDLPPYFLDFMMSMLGVPLVHVLGNHCYAPHDTDNHCSSECYPGAYNLDGRVAEYNGLVLAGVEGSPLYNMGPHQYTEQQIVWKLLRLSPSLVKEKVQSGRYLDVLVTHSPPRGIHDNSDLPHRGFEPLLGFMDRFKPTLMLHGHTHRYDPMLPARSRYGSTEIINVYGHCLIQLAREDQNSGWQLVTPETELHEVLDGRESQ